MWSSIRYVGAVLRHKGYVLIYGLKVGGIPLSQLLIHDLSKFSKAEFGPYIRRRETGIRSEEYLQAWKHHWQNNPHHWEYWEKDGVPTPMPEVYVREMFADWQAANINYGDVSLEEWIGKNYPKMRLHPETKKILLPLIASLGITIPQ